MLFQENFSIIDLLPGKLAFEAAPETFVPGRSFCSISFRLSGQIVVTGKHQTYHVIPQSIFYMPRGYDYATKVVESGEVYVVHFCAEDGFPPEPFVWKPVEPQQYEKLFSQILEVFPTGQRKDFVSMSLFYGLLAKIREDSKSERPYIPKRMLQVKARIHESFNDSTLSVAELARSAGLSEVYFRREFKACFGCQPVAYISSVRTEYAKALLETGEYSVSEVAIQSGYDNISYFSYRFREITGMTPSQYRDKATQKTKDP
jgi:AraC-like DNA-binding protein